MHTSATIDNLQVGVGRNMLPAWSVGDIMYTNLCIEEYLKKTPIDPVEKMNVVVGIWYWDISKYGFKSSATSLFSWI